MRTTSNPPNRKRYRTDLTDAQWSQIEDLIPRAKHHPNLQKPIHERREIVCAILYVLRTGCQWRNLPHDFPPWESVYHYFYLWRQDGVVDAILDRLRPRAREALGRKPDPTLGLIDSQSAKTTEATAEAARGFDAGKKVKGRKRHILVDACGILLAIVVTAASVQDRDGSIPLIHAAHDRFPTIEKILVDGAYVGEVIKNAEAATGITVEVTKRNEEARGFVPVRLRWAVERTFAWLGRYRRTSKDYERYPETEECVIKWAVVALLLQRLAPTSDADAPLPRQRC
jgi:putative transposase